MFLVKKHRGKDEVIKMQQKRNGFKKTITYSVTNGGVTP
jgi:hypothetical protein